jgi:transcriptional pleiotropic regulator of transition state genes
MGIADAVKTSKAIQSSQELDVLSGEAEHPRKERVMALPKATDATGRAVGTTRRLDQLGRIVVPAELRKMLGIHTGDLIDFRFIDGHIALLKVAAECVLCGRREDLVERRGKHICVECVRDLRKESSETGESGERFVELRDEFACGAVH